MLAADETVLAGLGLPIGRPTAAPDDEHRSASNSFYGFSVPRHLVFQVRQPGATSKSPSVPSVLHERPTYLLVGNPQTLERAEADFKEFGLYTVVHRYPGIWLSRDPYGLYKVINQNQGQMVPKSLPELKQVPGFNPIQLQAMEWQADFFELLTEDIAGLSFANDKKPHLRFPPGLSLPQASLGRDPVCFKILPNADVKPKDAESFLNQLRNLAHPIAFELVVRPESAYFQVTCASRDQELIRRQAAIYLPADIVTVSPAPLPQALHKLWARPKFAYRFLRTLSDFSKSPYSQILSTISKKQPPALILLQVLCAPVPTDSLNAVLACLQSYQQTLEAFAEGQRDWAKQIKEESSDVAERIRDLGKKYPPWLLSLRLMSSDPGVPKKFNSNFLKQFETKDQAWQVSAVGPANPLIHTVGRWNIVNEAELSSLVHLPANITSDLLETASAKARMPPPLYTAPGITLGTAAARGQTSVVTFPDSVRDRHLYLAGKSGTGKSTLLFNLALQDIQRGKGIAVIDPHGDLADDLLRHIPQDRIRDTIYFDPTRKDFTIPLPIFNAHSDEEVMLLADDLLITFKRFSESWGDRMDDILRYTFYTLLRTPGSSFADIAKLLRSPEFRSSIVTKLGDAQISDYWHHDFPSYPKDAARPILSRMSKFLLAPALAALLSHGDSKLDFSHIIENKKIFLAKISKGKLGPDNSKLLGSLLVSQFQLAAMRRANLPKDKRHPFFLYVDEFQNFTGSAFESILSEARKYGLCLSLGHQYISQLDDSIKKAIFGNVGTTILFKLWPEDLQAVKHELGHYEPKDLADLPNFHALCKPITKASDIFLMATHPPPSPPDDRTKEVIDFTHLCYGMPLTTTATTRPAQDSHSYPLPLPAIPQASPIQVAPHPPKAPREKRSDKNNAEPPLLGRGGPQHKYLQQLVKRFGEDRGYRATIEKEILDGIGSVDVALEKQQRSIACEISVTSSKDQEVSNIQKCLAAGFDQVILISTQKPFLAQAKEAASTSINPEDMKRVSFLPPESVIEFIEVIDARDEDREETVKGYKVKVKHKAVSDTDKKARQEVIGKTIMQALKRLKEPK